MFIPYLASRNSDSSFMNVGPGRNPTGVRMPDPAVTFVQLLDIALSKFLQIIRFTEIGSVNITAALCLCHLFEIAMEYANLNLGLF